MLPEDELEVALRRASMGNETLIIAMVNKAYMEEHENTSARMLELFLEGTRTLLDHLLFVAMDQASYDWCMFRWLNYYRLVTEGVDIASERLYKSDDFMKMMWKRTLFMLAERNYPKMNLK
ncbi:hypothetical protein RJ640_000516 [Escallonia rubra]|uniref:Nucleotide-diphospho-sugar transferase domain-containing protein n=1 Tax=Escallonia rubra TaxID=112253 RepID=A0AA88S379_9ASTE|nr:hypothetical protein RJ640_000516 [Escallonia rubra]